MASTQLKEKKETLPVNFMSELLSLQGKAWNQ